MPPQKTVGNRECYATLETVGNRGCYATLNTVGNRGCYAPLKTVGNYTYFTISKPPIGWRVTFTLPDLSTFTLLRKEDATVSPFFFTLSA